MDRAQAGAGPSTVKEAPLSDPRLAAIPDVHGHAKGEHKSFSEERPIAYSPRMLFLWFYHACARGGPRFMMVTDHINYLTFEDPGAVNTVRRALKLAEAGDLYGAAETAGVEVAHAAVVSEGLRRGMRFSIGAELDNDPRARPDAQNIVDAMRPDGMIRSVHFLTIEHPEKGPDWQWAFDNPEFKDLYEAVGTARTWELYMAKLLDDLEKLPGHIVGHFYVPAQFGHWPDQRTLEQYENQLLEVCAARGIAIEVNTRHLYREQGDDQKKKHRESMLRLIKKAQAKGVGIAVGSDAHSPKDQGAGFEAILKLLDEAKINELVFPVGGRLARVALRATKEHLQRVQSREPAPQPGSSISGLSRAELGLPERDESVLARTGHDPSARKRASGPARGGKRAAAKESKTAAKAAKTVKPAVKAAKAAPAAAKKSAKPAPKSAKGAKPAKPAKPAKAPKLAKSAKAAKAAKPVRSAKPSKTAKPKPRPTKSRPAKRPAKKSAAKAATPARRGAKAATKPAKTRSPLKRKPAASKKSTAKKTKRR